MNELRRYGLAIAFTVTTFVVALLAYRQLPDPIPIHWDLQGTADGWIAKGWGAFLVPLASAAQTALLIALGSRALRRAHSGSMARVYPTVVAALAGFMLFVTMVTTTAASGASLSVPSYVSTGTGLLLIVIGNLLGKTTRNPILGIRTPWTMGSDEVWSRTHRVGGWIMVLAGVAVVLAGIAGYGILTMVAIVLAAAMSSIATSYIIHRRVAMERTARP
jgi:uncharacterized membrane protein